MGCLVPNLHDMYLALVFLFDMGEEGGVGEVPLAAGTAELSFCFFLGLDYVFVVGGALFFRHIKYKYSKAPSIQSQQLEKLALKVYLSQSNL